MRDCILVKPIRAWRCANLETLIKQEQISKPTQIQVERNHKMKSKVIETQVWCNALGNSILSLT